MASTKQKQLSVMMDIAYDRKGDAFYDNAITYMAKVIAGVEDATSVTTVVPVAEVSESTKELNEELTTIKNEMKVAKTKITELEKQNKELLTKNEELEAKIAELESMLNSKTVEISTQETPATNTKVETNIPVNNGDIVEVISKHQSKKSDHLFNYGKIKLDEKVFLYKITSKSSYMLAEVLGASFNETVEATNLLRTHYGLDTVEFNENVLCECFANLTVGNIAYNCVVKKMPNSDTFIGYIGNHTFNYTPGMNLSTGMANKPWINKCDTSEQHAKIDKSSKMLESDAQRFKDAVLELVNLWNAKQPIVQENLARKAGSTGLPAGVTIDLIDASSEVTEEKLAARAGIEAILGQANKSFADFVGQKLALNAGINTSSPFGGHNFNASTNDEYVEAE